MSENTSPKDTEIDLGDLLFQLGKGISKISAFIRSIFDISVRVIFVIFLFLKRHFIKFVIAGLIGAIIGYTIDKLKTDEFEASMVVKPNYESGRQLYKNISYYEELVQQENFELLSQTFNITMAEAKTLVRFEINPVINENYMLSTYDDFLGSIDSTVALNFEYEDYTENFQDYRFSEHEIWVTSTSNSVFTKLESVIVSGVKENPFFQKLEESERIILARNEEYLETTKREVDTLRKVYTEVMIRESEKQNTQGTNINMAASEQSTKELSLFTQENRINTEKNNLTRGEVRNIEIINVISSFQKVGFLKADLIDTFILRLSILAIGFMLIWLLGLELKKLN